VQHSIRTDSFCVEDERFFGSYEAEQVAAGGALTLEFDPVEAQPPTAEQRAHFTRFRRPVAGFLAAMGSLALLGLAQHAFQQNSRPEVVAHIGSATRFLTSAAPNNRAEGSGLPGRSVLTSAAEHTSGAPWSSTELAGSAIALPLETTLPGPSGGELSLLADSGTQVTLVNDFTSALLSICRNVPS
jgi:hypothetical protein